MELANTIKLLHKSSQRMARAFVNLPQNLQFWTFMRREAQVHHDRAQEIIDEAERHLPTEEQREGGNQGAETQGSNGSG